MLNDKIKNAILKLQEQYPHKRSALIPALHMAQTQEGYLPAEIQHEVAKLFDLEPSEVLAIVTFYDMFFDKPVGKKVIHVCKNLSCMLCGCDELLQSLCEKCHVAPGETSADGEYTILTSECLGACDRAPVMIVGEQLIGPVKESDLESLLNSAQPEGQAHG